MNDTSDLELRAHIEALVYKKYAGELSIEEEAELTKLLAAHPHLSSIQSELETLIAEGVLEKKPQVEAIAPRRRAFEYKIDQSARKKKIRQRVMAVSLFLLLGVGGLFFLYNNTPKTIIVENNISDTSIVLTMADGQVIALGGKNEITTSQGGITSSTDSVLIHSNGSLANQYNELKVPEKLDYAIALSDGTRIRLNSSTMLRFPFAFNGEKREVFIDGEAYFTITPNAQQPFIVNTPVGSIEVLGTEFNVNTYVNNRLITSLISGATTVRAEKERLQLTPGKEAIVLRGKPILKRSFDPSTTLSWMKGVFFFDQAPLKEIASMIQRWYGYNVIFDEQPLQEILLTAHLDKRQPIQSFLTMLNNTTSINYYFKGGNLHLH